MSNWYWNPPYDQDTMSIYSNRIYLAFGEDEESWFIDNDIPMVVEGNRHIVIGEIII